ncbi:MAG: SPFH domain-containing protein, partial [Polyangiaceae bacterium]
MEPLLGLSVTALMFFGFVCFVILLRSFRVINEYERGVIFRLGKVGQSGVKSPGLRIVLPLIDRLVRVDLRTVTLDVPPQEVITKDNVTIKVNAVVYFNVMNPV